MIYAAAAGGAASWPERVAKTIASPFVRIATNISTWVEGNIDTLVNANRYKAENEKLRQDVADLLMQIVDIDELKNDNSQLREMLDIAVDHPDFEWPTNTCTIIARNAIDPFGGFTINRGSDDRIGVQDLVITRKGVAGVVTKVAPNYAEVSTILSTETEIGVLTTSGNVKGIVQNDIVHAMDGLVRVWIMDKDADVEVGDTFVTIGGVTYPPNQIIGRVVEIFDDPNGLTKHALVQPSENVFRLTNVLVVTNFEGREQTVINTVGENE
jgi:rod shape-determining protein MreC